MSKEAIKEMVKRQYGSIASKSGSSCGPDCCGSSDVSLSKGLGYSGDELSSIPDSANLGLGCGNPTALADIEKGEVVLDLGSGAGIDCFLAAQKVGKSGSVIGIDMTDQMLEKARKNAQIGGFDNVTFRKGEIEMMGRKVVSLTLTARK